MGVMEVQIRGPRPESNEIVPVARARVDGPLVQRVPVRTYPQVDSHALRFNFAAGLNWRATHDLIPRKMVVPLSGHGVDVEFSHSEWWGDFLDGVAKELHPSTPESSRAALSALRRRVDECRYARTRRRFERDLDALLENDRFVRPAVEWYLKKRVPQDLRKAAETLARGQAVLAEYSSKKGRKRRKRRD